MSAPLPRTTPGVSPQTWAFWVVALTPLLTVIGIAVIDVDGYVRASVQLALQPDAASGSATLPPGFMNGFLSIAAGSLLSLVGQVAFVVFSAVDWTILRRRGVDRPFHWAWSFLTFVSFGGLVHPIGRTVVVRRRTGVGASAPLVVFIVLTALGIVVGLVKVVAALAAIAPQLQQLSTAP